MVITSQELPSDCSQKIIRLKDYHFQIQLDASVRQGSGTYTAGWPLFALSTNSSPGPSWLLTWFHSPGLLNTSITLSWSLNSPLHPPLWAWYMWIHKRKSVCLSLQLASRCWGGAECTGCSFVTGLQQSAKLSCNPLIIYTKNVMLGFWIKANMNSVHYMAKQASTSKESPMDTSLFLPH